MNTTLQEKVTGIQVVKAFTQEDYEIERFSQRVDALRHPAYKTAWWVAYLNPLLVGIGQLAIVFGIRIGGSQVLIDASLNVGQVVAFTQYLSLTIAPLALAAIVIPVLLCTDASAGDVTKPLSEGCGKETNLKE